MSGLRPAPRILIVDDAADVRSFMTDALGALGYHVRTAAGANEALALMAHTPFNLVMCDLRLPGLGGWEFVVRLRDVDPSVAVIMLTGAASDDYDVDRIRETGIAVLHKPVTLLQLHTTVTQALSKPSV
jgi:DNA-binding NtrC family response regulator